MGAALSFSLVVKEHDVLKNRSPPSVEGTLSRSLPCRSKVGKVAEDGLKVLSTAGDGQPSSVQLKSSFLCLGQIAVLASLALSAKLLEKPALSGPEAGTEKDHEACKAAGCTKSFATGKQFPRGSLGVTGVPEVHLDLAPAGLGQHTLGGSILSAEYQL